MTNVRSAPDRVKMTGVTAAPDKPKVAQEPAETIAPARPDVPAIRDLPDNSEGSGCDGPWVPVVADIAELHHRGDYGRYADGWRL